MIPYTMAFQDDTVASYSNSLDYVFDVFFILDVSKQTLNLFMYLV
jgi:hypothetical protein